MRYAKSVTRNISVFGIAGLVCLFTSGKGMASQAAREYVEDELLVQFKAGVPNEKVTQAIAGAEATEDEEIPQIRVKKIKVPPQALEKVKASLKKNPHVNFVENNSLARGGALPNDPSYASQWHLPKISAPLAWDISTGSASVDIAIVDSGVDPAHPDLAGKLIPGYNFLIGNSDTHDVLGHGTAVAGTAGAIANNAKGVSGVAWQNQIMPLVVLDASDYASYSNIAQAITYAADHGVRVINVSIGGSSSSSTLQNAVTYAWNKGALVFVSAMNNNTSTPYYPAACANAIAVASTNSADAKASFSNYGTWITLTAPGEYIYTTNNGGGYGAWNGTSFSSPMTAGLAALILSVNPMLSNAQVLDILKKNADDLGATGFDTSFGYGRINAYKSLVAAQTAIPQTDTISPAVSISSPSSGSIVNGLVAVNVPASDNVGVARVDLFINGALFATGTTSPFSFSWDTTTVTDATYTLTASAYDAAGNIAQSSAVTAKVVNTPDILPPTVTIISPANGAKIANSVTVNVSATDNVGVTKTELYIDGLLKATSNSGSLSWNWNSRKVAGGTHTITSKAYDGAANIRTTSISVTK